MAQLTLNNGTAFEGDETHLHTVLTSYLRSKAKRSDEAADTRPVEEVKRIQGSARRVSQRAWTKEEDAQMINLWEQGIKAKEIARILNRLDKRGDATRVHARVKTLREEGVNIPYRMKLPHGKKREESVKVPVVVTPFPNQDNGEQA